MAREVLGQLRLDLGRPPVSQGLAVHVDRRLPVVRRPRRRRPPDPRAPRVHRAAPRRRRPARVRPALGAFALLRPRAQRLGARIGQRADPPSRDAAADLLAARHRPRRRAETLRLPARRVPLRRAARTPASRSASTASPRSSPARRTSARSSRSRRRSPASTPSRTPPPPIDDAPTQRPRPQSSSPNPSDVANDPIRLASFGARIATSERRHLMVSQVTRTVPAHGIEARVRWTIWRVGSGRSSRGSSCSTQGSRRAKIAALLRAGRAAAGAVARLRDARLGPRLAAGRRWRRCWRRATARSRRTRPRPGCGSSCTGPRTRSRSTIESRRSRRCGARRPPHDDPSR